MSSTSEIMTPYHITETEIGDSQLSVDDLRILMQDAGEDEGDVRCESKYCEKNYQSAQPEEAEK